MSTDMDINIHDRFFGLIAKKFPHWGFISKEQHASMPEVYHPVQHFARENLIEKVLTKQLRNVIYAEIYDCIPPTARIGL